MRFLSVLRVVQQSAEKGSSDATALAFTLIAIVAAVLGLGKPAIEFLQARAAKASVVPADTYGGILAKLDTERERYPSSLQWRLDKMATGVIGFFTSVIATLLLFAAAAAPSFSDSLDGLGTGILYTVAACMYWWKLAQVLRKKAGDVVASTDATVCLQGDFSEICARCRQALTAIGAVKARGCQVDIVTDQTARFQGGMGKWPSRVHGYRVTLHATFSDTREHTVEIESACFWPYFRQQRKNDHYVGALLLYLIP